MTEKTLEVAIEMKKQIDQLKKDSEEIERAKELCYGNTGDLNKRDYFITIKESCYTEAHVRITATAALKALEWDEMTVNGNLCNLADQFQELH